MKNKIISLKKETYTVISPLGKGGQASVWKVRRHRDDKELAMKSVLTAKKDGKGHTEYLAQTMVDNLRLRLQSEIDFIQSLPNTRKVFIVPCLDSGMIDDDRYGQLPAWVMPLYKHTLADKMPPYPKDKPIPVLFSECLKWIEQAAIALEATHSFSTGSSRFVHRDVKASNLMLTDKGDIRLIDFGIVRETIIDEETGTHSYSAESAAPEQVLPIRINAGKNSYAIGTHSDMYALGSVFYYLFSGKQSEAQQKLGEKDLFSQHIQMLDDNNTGMIGSLGGLTDAEYNDLLEELQFRFDEEYADAYATKISALSGELQNSEYITRSIADFIRALLDPIYRNRPSAAQMRLWCQSIKEALSPQLSELKLSTTQNKIVANTPVTINLSMIGKGLPANADWVEITVNGEIVYTGFKPLDQDKHYFGFVKSEQTSWELVVSSKENAPFLEVNAKALVNDRVIQDNLKIKINETADDLWQQGKHQQALCLELRKEWLDELHQNCDSFAAAASYSELLKSLQKCQPKQLQMIALYQQKLEQKFNPNPDPKPIVEPENHSIERPDSELGLSADNLWNKGHYKQALYKELRDDWLDSLIQSCKTPQDIEERARLFKSLKKHHPNQEAKLNFNLKLLQEKSEKIAKDKIIKPNPSSKKYLVGTAIALSIVAIIGYFSLQPKKTDPIAIDDLTSGTGSGGFTPTVPDIPANNPNNPPIVPPVSTSDAVKPVTPPALDPKTKQEKELARLKKDLNGSNSNNRKRAWKRLNQLSKKNNYQAKTMIANFVKQTFNLASSNNKKYQKQAFERLNLIAASGNKSAIKSLGQAYYEGIGTQKNWKESWRQLKQADAKPEKNQLELKANTILHSDKSTREQRDLAYQAAEITARNEGPGDPSQKWMVYRYQTGDGVPVDKAKAQWWQDVYDGKRRLTPTVGEQW
ncbi:MAG TPA: hypothetical protein ENJ28_01865 [Gammaproteobacteria bacterium]|nr:hypothetical protein [Gammaproteobacteria bacterium]